MLTRTLRLWCMTFALVLVAGIAGCTAKSDDVQAFAGHWRSPQWGEHFIVVDGNTAKIIYEHLDGRVVGTIDRSTLTGWWTEAPERQPSAQAGEVEFTLAGAGEARTIHGTWRHGGDGAVRQDWDLVWVDTEIPAEVRARFDDAVLFIQHP
jgi:hypothetical protein